MSFVLFSFNSCLELGVNRNWLKLSRLDTSQSRQFFVFTEHCLFSRHPTHFSKAFGVAATREERIESAQDLHCRPVSNAPATTSDTPAVSDSSNFEVLALLSAEQDGTLDTDKAKDLIKMFRPDRDGNMDIVTFVKSIDMVCKELRLLRAVVVNSSKVN